MSATAGPTRTGIANLPLHYGKAPRWLFSKKNGIPYPVDRKTYDQSIELLSKAINKTKLGIREKNEALGRLNGLRIK
ncbi:hypothetical protein ACFLUU_06920 [Chloroflexota bacterium]